MKKEYIRSFGAIKNEFDARDRSLSSYVGAVDISSITDYETKEIHDFPVLNQKALGACVGHAEALAKSIIDYIETGKKELLSARYLYALTKQLEGNSYEGTFPRNAAKILIDKGCATDKLVPNNTDLVHADYISYKETSADIKDASKHKISSYAFCLTDGESLARAIYQFKVITVTIPANSNWTITPIEKPKKDGSGGLHRILFYGFKRTEKGLVFKWRNSWGETFGNKGNSQILFSDYQGCIYDPMTYVDSKTDYLETENIIDTATPEYTFTKSLYLGNTKNDFAEVKALQICLLSLGLFYNKIKGDTATTGFYGKVTEDSVRRFQSSKAFTLVNGKVGPLTRFALNQIFSKKKIYALAKQVFN
jgi:Papain family cysteine protease/Putative peptidoglycan binding domain